MKYQKEALSAFSDQIKDRLAEYVPHNLNYKDFNNVVLCGLGGSGIGGRIAKSYFSDKASLPIEVVSKYTLPKFVNEKSLVILGSYSGNTEETLSMLIEAEKRICKTIILTSGGELLKIGTEKEIPVYLSKPALQPRMALGYSLTNLLLILEEFFQISLKGELLKGSNKVADFNFFIDLGKALFEKTKTGLKSSFVIISDDLYEPIATRFAQQIQENAKLEAFVNVLPEANHNVIETYHSKSPNTYFLLNSGANQRTTHRFSFVKNLLWENGNTVVEIPTSGVSLTNWLELIFTLDWTSLWMADSLSRESESVPIIKELKEYLADQK
jgi:glucose/mannose-6-phosphate isomerase